MARHIVPFHNDLLPQAGALLAQRHQRDRALLPMLPGRFTDPLIASEAITAILQRPHARGYAALEDDRLVAYIIGDILIDEVWGRSGWVRTPGCAYDFTTDVNTVRALYAALGDNWVRYGVFTHIVRTPVTDPALVHAWFSLSFGIQQEYALIDLQTLDLPAPEPPEGISIRQAGSEDKQQLAELSEIIWKQQVQAPVWAVMPPENVSQNREGWATLGDDQEATVWLAMRNGQALGVQGYWPSQAADDNLFIPDQCVELSVAGTRASVRGQGIGTLLTHHGLAHARANGFLSCETNWRSTNLLSSRFWPHQGFRPVVYRLARYIDSRILWAQGEHSNRP